jgi:hypothetical protein
MWHTVTSRCTWTCTPKQVNFQLIPLIWMERKEEASNSYRYRLNGAGCLKRDAAAVECHDLFCRSESEQKTLPSLFFFASAG